MRPPSSRHTGSEAGPRCWSLTMTQKLMPTVLQGLYLPTPARVRVLHWLPVPCAGPLPRLFPCRLQPKLRQKAVQHSLPTNSTTLCQNCACVLAH